MTSAAAMEGTVYLWAVREGLDQGRSSSWHHPPTSRDSLRRRGTDSSALSHADERHQIRRLHPEGASEAQRSARLETIESLARALRVQPAELMPPIRVRRR